MTGGDIEDQSVDFEGAKYNAGWSFRNELDLGMLSAIELMPKVGIWSYTYAENVELVVKQESSLEFEVGLESAQEFYALKGWWAFGTTLSSGASSGVQSNRGGFDIHLLGPNLGVLRTSVLLFFMSEKTTITGGNDDILDIRDYSFGYAGGGIALSW